MYNKKRFPTREADFVVTVTIVINYFTVEDNKSRLVITPSANAALAQAITIMETYVPIYQQCQNSNIATATMITTKNALRNQLEATLRLVYIDIQSSILTQADRDTLNIPVPSNSRSAVPPPSSIPSIDVMEQSHLSVTFKFKDLSNSKSNTLPEDISKVDIEYAVETKNDAGVVIVPTDDDYRHVGISNKTKYTFNYSQDKMKATVYVRARYLNSRNESGNWSQNIILVLI